MGLNEGCFPTVGVSHTVDVIRRAPGLERRTGVDMEACRSAAVDGSATGRVLAT